MRPGKGSKKEMPVSKKEMGKGMKKSMKDKMRKHAGKKNLKDMMDC